MKFLRICSTVFQREKDGPEETGISINEGDGPLIDLDGNIVPVPIWRGRGTSQLRVMVFDESEVYDSRTKEDVPRKR